MFTLPKLKMMTAALVLSAGAAFAAVTPQQIAADYASQGFTRVEIKTGPTQMKVEAIRGTEKREVIIDIATGTVLKSETETVGAFENTSPGVFVRNRNRDFVRVSDDDSSDDDSNDDSNDDSGGDDDRDDDDDNGGNSGSGGSDDDEDDDNSGSGSDDDDDDDNGGNSGHGGGDDDDDDDDSGSDDD